MKRTIALSIAFAAALPLPAQDSLQPLTDSPAMQRAFAPVLAAAERATAEVLADDQVVALATVVAADGWLCSKASEVLRKPGAALACRLGERTLKATTAGEDPAADLVLLRVDANDLQPAEWAKSTPAAGALLASTGGGELPLGIGILGCAPYRHGSQRGFLGVRMQPKPVPARLLEVLPHTAAAAADLRVDDVVVEFEDNTVASSGQLLWTLGTYHPGETVRIVVRRGEQQLEKHIELGTDHRGPVSSQEPLWGELSEVRAGFGMVLEHDTVLKPAQCGGPLVDLDGKVVGVNIARAGRVETLALPAATVVAFVARVRAAAR